MLRISVFMMLSVCSFLPAVRGEDISYVRDVKSLLKTKCFSCHGVLKQESSLRLDTAEFMRTGGDSGPAIEPGNAKASLIIQRVRGGDGERMPPEGEPLTSSQIAILERWITEGAVAPDSERPQTDPAEHWSFQPLPALSDFPPDSSIDGFIAEMLQRNSLQMSPPADRVTLLRRLFLDLHGLPPEMERVDAFLHNEAHDAWSALVDQVLASPRYGERWAQHWLDVVRYADTHGYEVNTPRPDAWPYRDYVIESFNNDLPYDQFVREQLAGDGCGADAATGFLVAAPVLLPGQIGKDDASIRLARQDALDEIIVGTSATFLGLTVGCARCHDHKFDPVLQNDYYAMQAFFAGVDYGSRTVHDPESEMRRETAEQIAKQISEYSARLAAFQPRAFTGRTVIIDDEDAESVTVLKTRNGHGINPDGDARGYRNDVGSESRMPNISRGRYTWWPNVPGEDTFTWDPATAGQFRVWISWGAHGSGVHTRDARYILDRDGDLQTVDDQQQIAQIDQYYFSGVESGESEQKPLWSGLYDAGIHEFDHDSRLVLRGGQTGTGITADVIVLQECANQDSAAETLPQLRGPVNAVGTSEYFPAVTARYVRFTSLATIDNNRHQPCIDELEVYTDEADSRNIALATCGTRATSSGNYATTGKHQLPHINDGQYGNSHSWISNEFGRGWVQLEFVDPVPIHRVEWARDREGEFSDRLPVRYRIDVSMDAQDWQLVASSDDRVALTTPHDDVTMLNRRHGKSHNMELKKLLTTIDSLKQQKSILETPKTVYGGVFRQPDPTFVLARGDAEQPQQEIGAGIPQIFGEAAPPHDASEYERRAFLAEWISSAANPLTARVIVNRVWQYHFGQGIVETSSDFGMNGAVPTHPELLDWLSADLIASGWSLKHLHRRILNSLTFRQSSRIDPRAVLVDSDCRLLWRFPSRRIEAEAIRDCALAVSGRLNLQSGGPGFDFFKTRGGLSGFPPVEEFGPDKLRRMIFAHKIRMEPVPVFGAFDCPDAGQATPRRSQSTTAVQALNLFNSSFMLTTADTFAARAEQDSPADPIGFVYRTAYGRSPSEEESRIAEKLVDQHGLAVLCRAVLNSNEFLFIP